MNIGGRKFKPTRWSILMTLAGVILFASLGNWQLERAAYKESIKLRFEQRLTQAYRPFNAADGLEDIEYRRLTLNGRFDNAHHFLLDNQLHQGKAGYQVLTPLQLENSDSIILVNRGWAAWGAAREPLPEISPTAPVNQVAGIASLPTKSVFQLGEVELSENWPQLIPYLDIEALRAQYSDRLLPMVLWLAPEQPGYYVRAWNPVWLSPEKSRAYALQWFSFAAIALVLFIVLNLRKAE